MKNLKSVKIFGKKVKIKKEDLSSRHAAGLYRPDESEIIIDKNLKGRDYDSTLLHEIGHAIIDHSFLNQTSLSFDVQELVVEAYSQALLDIFVIRPKKSKSKA